MRILCVATKLPWPAVDGGRLVLYDTLRALAAAGHEITLVAPILDGDAIESRKVLNWVCQPHPVEATLRPPLVDAGRAQISRRPWTVVRHRLPAMRQRVTELLRTESFDVIHAEQVQALGSVDNLAGSTPVVWRAQNVESDLWRATARQSFWRRPILTLEAWRLARWEGAAVRRTAATITLTREDREQLAKLSSTPDRLHRVAAPFAPELPPAERELDGDPAVVLLGSGGWLPNRGGARWFVEQVWPRVHSQLGGAVLHIFGTGLDIDRPAVRVHPPPDDSRDAFAPGSILVVPLAIASGVRMKILEAWARGVPVVATPAAVRGLDAESGRELAVAENAAEFVDALRDLTDPETAAAQVVAGRELLKREHAFDRIAAQLTEIYSAAT